MKINKYQLECQDSIIVYIVYKHLNLQKVNLLPSLKTQYEISEIPDTNRKRNKSNI